jgi:hypothetical protein
MLCLMVEGFSLFKPNCTSYVMRDGMWVIDFNGEYAKLMLF